MSFYVTTHCVPVMSKDIRYSHSHCIGCNICVYCLIQPVSDLDISLPQASYIPQDKHYIASGKEVLQNVKCLELLWYQSIRSNWPFNVAVLIWIFHSGLLDDTLVWLTNSNTIPHVYMYMSVISILDKYTHIYIYIWKFDRWIKEFLKKMKELGWVPFDHIT